MTYYTFSIKRTILSASLSVKFCSRYASRRSQICVLRFHTLGLHGTGAGVEDDVDFCAKNSTVPGIILQSHNLSESVKKRNTEREQFHEHNMS